MNLLIFCYVSLELKYLIWFDSPCIDRSNKIESINLLIFTEEIVMCHWSWSTPANVCNVFAELQLHTNKKKRQCCAYWLWIWSHADNLFAVTLYTDWYIQKIINCNYVQMFSIKKTMSNLSFKPFTKGMYQ